uniref:Prion protein, related sequence 3 n=2 Tax=Cynoglossus semilaevis TaxID=244447 RepID=A0A3P8WVD9_CYNSE
MEMKQYTWSTLCLLVILFHTYSSLAKRGGGGFGKGFSAKKFPAWRRGFGRSNTNTGQKNVHGSSSKGGHHKQHGQSHYGTRSGYPRQAWGYHHQYPVQGNPNGRTYGGYGGHGGYPGGYINQNPNNRILSPHYGGSFGYGGYGVGGGSPFSHSVQSMGMYPQDRSRGFGHSAVVAAAGGAFAGMALGYGLGRFPRPHFHFHSPEEEYYYNHYMYRRYGIRSTDDNDYGRDYKYGRPTETYDNFMDSCMKKTDLLPAENPRTDTGNEEAAENTTRMTKPEPNPASEAVGDDQGDGDTVSIVEIGYPALIDQIKARKCLELYMAYSEKYLQRHAAGGQGLEVGWRGLLAVVGGVVVMLVNSNVLLQ